MPPKRKGSSKKGKKSGWLRKIGLGINFILVVVTLLACISPYISPEKFWLPAFAGLTYPFLLMANLLFILFWLVVSPRISLVSLAALLVGAGMFFNHFQFHYPDEFDRNAPEVIRVTTHNVRNFEIWGKYSVPDYTTYDRMLNFYRSDSADILCLQEAVISHERVGNLAEKTGKSLGYPSLARAAYINGGVNGMLIFFRGTKKNSGIITHSGRTIAVFADAELPQGTFRVYNVHLQSNRIGGEEYVMERLGPEAYRDSLFLRGSRVIARKIRLAGRIRAQQAEILREHISSSPYPVIVCGDLNDTPASYTYAKVRKGLQDTFAKAGRGFGRTYRGTYPSYRIDYIFASPAFNVNSHTVQRYKLGDHNPVSAWLSSPVP
ncbi:MAG TPA: endonuclease/exonuclease/phosphatase family protein [Bacteroidales bacterium]|nr:endonuclease/exonuclease/phosphatase family protein [Bacteroidales bacterium]HRZ48625.1 endonuclease/exonuclease/phosphatase family protein [Bacteroidales bacterium]